MSLADERVPTRWDLSKKGKTAEVFFRTAGKNAGDASNRCVTVMPQFCGVECWTGFLSG